MKIKLFENFDEINLDIQYVLRTVDVASGEEHDVPLTNDDFDYNPYSLEDMVKLYLVYKKQYDQLHLVKITEEIVDEDTINKVKVNLTAKKYNL